MSNCIVENVECVQGLDPVARLITNHDMVRKADDNLFGGLQQACIDAEVSTKEEWYAFLLPYEISILEVRFANGEDVKTPKGKWKLGHVSMTPDGKFSSTYRSNKATIGKALDCAVPLIDSDGKPLGKSALAKSYASPPTVKTAYEKCVAATTIIDKQGGALSSFEQDWVISKLEELISRLR